MFHVKHPYFSGRSEKHFQRKKYRNVSRETSKEID